MSWKLRRAGWKSCPPNTAKIFNAFTVASVICTFLGFVAYQIPVIGGLIAIFWLLSLVTTPWLVCMTLAGGTWGYGLPNLKRSKLRSSNVYDAPSKIPSQKPQYTDEQKRRLEEIDQEIKKSQEKIDKNELKIKEYEEKYKQLVEQEKLEKRKEKLKKLRKKEG